MRTAGAGEPQAEAGEDAVEAAKAAKEEYTRTLQEQEASLQQRQTDKMQVRPSACCSARHEVAVLMLSVCSRPSLISEGWTAKQHKQ